MKFEGTWRSSTSYTVNLSGMELFDADLCSFIYANELIDHLPLLHKPATNLDFQTLSTDTFTARGLLL